MGLNLTTGTESGGAFATSVESTLSLADEPVDVLRDRLLLAMRYTFSWGKAIGEASAPDLASIALGPAGAALGTDTTTAGAQLAARVADMQSQLSALLDAMPPSLVFVGTDLRAAYESTSSAFAQLYRDLALSLATLPQRSLLDQAGDLGSAVLAAPTAAVKTLAEEISQTLAKVLGNTAAAIWSNLWPVILIGAAVGLVYVFRRPLARAVGKVAS